MGSKLVLVSAVPDDPLSDEMLTSFDEQRKWDDVYEDRTTYLRRMKQELLATGLQVETHMKYGLPEEAILQISDWKHADLIVMTTHGRGGLQELWPGRVASQIVRDASQTVLLVRSNMKGKPPAPGANEREIVVPVTGY